jgi:hypothetical protein
VISLGISDKNEWVRYFRIEKNILFPLMTFVVSREADSNLGGECVSAPLATVTGSGVSVIQSNPTTLSYEG